MLKAVFNLKVQVIWNQIRPDLSAEGKGDKFGGEFILS